VRLGALLFLLTAGCHPMTTPVPPKTALSPDDQVTTAADRDHKNGTIVEVFGTYVLTEGKDQGTVTGHAAVRIADGTLIHLAPPWHPEAIRPDEERKLAGQPVVAKGLLFAECPPPPDGRSYARVACLYLGLKVIERSTYDFLHGGEPE
jgi:hypothetical protein